MNTPNPPTEPFGAIVYELALAVGAAFLAGYVRAKAKPEPFSFASLLTKVAEAIVCGFLAIGISAAIDNVDQRLTVGISAGLALIGTGVLSDLLTRFLAARADKV